MFLPRSEIGSAMSFDNAAQQMLEDMFGMSNGYLLEFSNGTFARFLKPRPWSGLPSVRMAS